MTFRETALNESVAIGGTDAEILLRAERFFRFLQGLPPTRLVLEISPARMQNTEVPTSGTRKEADMAQMHDDQEFDVTVTAKDAKGFEVTDVFTATVDNADVASITPGTDGKTFTVVAGNPGSAVVTVTDGTLSATLAVDVVPGSVALISLEAGDPVAQPTA